MSTTTQHPFVTPGGIVTIDVPAEHLDAVQRAAIGLLRLAANSVDLTDEQDRVELHRHVLRFDAARSVLMQVGFHDGPDYGIDGVEIDVDLLRKMAEWSVDPDEFATAAQGRDVARLHELTKEADWWASVTPPLQEVA